MAGTEKTRKHLSLNRMVPNMLTVTGMCAGLTSIQFAIAQKWEAAVLAIVVAAFIDGFDGAAARLLKATSKFGAELDSLSDFLCFGVAPALVIYLWSLHEAGKLGWIASLVFCVAVALRLARFNAAADEEEGEDEASAGKAAKKTPLALFFTGIPAPTGAGMTLLPMIVSFQLTPEMSAMLSGPKIVGYWALFMAALMVSRLPVYSSKHLRLPQKMAVPALAVFGLMAAALINAPWPTLTFIGIAYAVSVPFGVRYYFRLKAEAARQINADKTGNHGHAG